MQPQSQRVLIDDDTEGPCTSDRGEGHIAVLLRRVSVDYRWLSGTIVE